MNYAIFRSEPIYTLNDLAQIGSHNKREKKAYQSNPDIDLSKTKDNVELFPLNMKYVKGFYEITKDYKKEHEERMKNEREDRKRTFRQMVDKSKSVVADELVFTATHTFFNDMSKEAIRRGSKYFHKITVCNGDIDYDIIALREYGLENFLKNTSYSLCCSPTS